MAHLTSRRAAVKRNANQQRRRDQRLEARVVVERRWDGSAEIYCFDPQTNRTIRTGLVRNLKQVPREVAQLVGQLQRAGNSVAVVEKEVR